MPAAKKAPARRQRRNRPKDSSQVAILRPLTVPAPPAKFTPPVQRAWDDYWSSDIAGLALPTDYPELERLFLLRDERERSWKAAIRKRIVPGSTEQPVLNPLFKLVATLDAEIRALEDRFGLSPQARLKLGMVFGQAKASLEQLNREVDEYPDEGETDERLALVRESGTDG